MEITEINTSELRSALDKMNGICGTGINRILGFKRFRQRQDKWNNNVLDRHWKRWTETLEQDWIGFSVLADFERQDNWNNYWNK